MAALKTTMRAALLLAILALVAAPAAADTSWYTQENDAGAVEKKVVPKVPVYFEIDNDETTDSADLILGCSSVTITSFESASSAGGVQIRQRAQAGSTRTNKVLSDAGDVTLDASTAGRIGIYGAELGKDEVIYVDVITAAGAAASGEWFQVKVACVD